MAAKKCVLITGAGGKIGTVLREVLSDTCELSGIDRAPAPGECLAFSPGQRRELSTGLTMLQRLLLKKPLEDLTTACSLSGIPGM